ncbi:hypothetical protein [Natranaeroarchaeum aerophilus]|uniref:Uncharacterized protein n=1 Tax=Natranaeroarchaeum aerophilus TaxID=2917711 RepID=A0AAE3FLW7_9EURY|nr:hypothetical protein [Natranaeroarchaeum aerophilus]MCL9812207.1 hypothetical protein [Natranaeroarchaeum aerophilus]
MDKSGSDRSVWFGDEYPNELREFVLERGAVEYLSFLSQEPRRFVEMQEELAIGDGTLTELHARAEGLHLRRIDQQKRDGKYYRVYRLTPMGEVIVQRMQEIGVTQRHDRLRTIRREYQRAKDEYTDWVEDPDGFVANIEEYLDMIIQDASTESLDSSLPDPVSEHTQSLDETDLGRTEVWGEQEETDNSEES